MAPEDLFAELTPPAPSLPALLASWFVLGTLVIRDQPGTELWAVVDPNPDAVRRGLDVNAKIVDSGARSNFLELSGHKPG